MHVRWPKCSVRRLMVATAIVAVLIGLHAEIERRRTRFAALARLHALARDEMHDYMSTMTGSGPVQFFGDRASVADLIARHGRLKAKYEDAAQRPWLPVVPD